MDAAISFGQQHFGAGQYGDLRLTRRAVVSADALLAHPAGTLPGKLRRAELLGFYDFSNNVKVDHATVLAVHRQQTRAALETGSGVKLLIHDTTEMDCTGLTMEDLGPIGNGTRRGLLLHHVLAVEYDATGRRVLGLLEQFPFRRREVPKGETPVARRKHPGRESRLWTRGVQAVGRPPAGTLWVNLMDRGGEAFAALQRQLELGQHFVVRSKSSRKIACETAPGVWALHDLKLHPWARSLPRVGTRALSVQANAGQVPRETTVAVGYGVVQIQAPRVKRDCGQGRQPLTLAVIHVREVAPPSGEEGLEWVLLTDLVPTHAAGAWERVDWYACRPIIEEFHKAQKTGGGIELLQFTTRHAVEVAVAMLSVVAVGLLQLRDLARDPAAAATAACTIVPTEYVRVLSAWRYQEVRDDLSVAEFCLALARLGGHLGRRQDRLPGWLVLWRGWMELHRLVEGTRLQRVIKRCG